MTSSGDDENKTREGAGSTSLAQLEAALTVNGVQGSQGTVQVAWYEPNPVVSFIRRYIVSCDTLSAKLACISVAVTNLSFFTCLAIIRSSRSFVICFLPRPGAWATDPTSRNFFHIFSMQRVDTPNWIPNVWDIAPKRLDPTIAALSSAVSFQLFFLDWDSFSLIHQILER